MAARRPRALYLLRHAKSSWDDPDLDDHDRPLAKRGVRAAGAIARHIWREGIQPALVLCSSARRARQTLDLIAPAIGDADAWVSRSSTAPASPISSVASPGCPRRCPRRC